jgi:hypothetical protein
VEYDNCEFSHYLNRHLLGIMQLSDKIKRTKKNKPEKYFGPEGGEYRSRTGDLLHAMQAL